MGLLTQPVNTWDGGKMKVCRACQCVYLRQLVICPQCRCEAWDELLVSLYDDYETWEGDYETDS